MPGAPSFFETITHSGPVGFGVLLLLVAFSVASWGIIVLKWLALKQAQKLSVEFLETFWQSKRLDEIFQRSEEMTTSPLAQVFRAGYQELVKVKQREQGTKDKAEMSFGGIENIERALRRASTAEMTELEREARHRTGDAFEWRPFLESVVSHGTPPMPIIRDILFGD